ncbi:hypothetical protein [Candidatus Absconditicoccus praedator]|uniref:hypothetical protein n=1 Tax=Candidatus Absconditicoccus praedator TaxID=2735562 RepID=UPI001E574B13|nr:hypothetical protein [Candidatus Absconditicoccus praedator]UFX83366.1 hypothetical protein HLG78_04525 [Candidatus Absconditicoccus praedator]
MVILLETLKGIFFLMSIIVGIFFLRGDYILEDSIFELSGNILMPGYLLLTGIMLGYIISFILISKDDLKEKEDKDKAYIKGLAIGTLFGMIFSGVYILSII